MNLSRCLISTRRSSSLKTHTGSRRKGQVVPHAPYHIPLGGHSGLRIVSGALLGATAGRRAARTEQRFGRRRQNVCFAVRCRVGRVAFFHGVSIRHRLEPPPWWRSRQNIWLGKIPSDWDCSASGAMPLGFSKVCFRCGRLKKFMFRAAIRERRQKFCEEGEKLLGISVLGVDKPEQAVRGMDVVLTATNSLTPIFPEDWVEPGTHVSSMGKPTEIEPRPSFESQSHRRWQPGARTQLWRPFRSFAAGRIDSGRKTFVEPDSGVGRIGHRTGVGPSQPR